MNEYTITYNVEVTVIVKGEIYPAETIIANLKEGLKEHLAADDLHIRDFKIFPTGGLKDVEKM